MISLVSAWFPAGAALPGFWINEFHYDNTGADVGEFVEVVAPADFTDLAAVRLVLYNGGDGRTYGTPHPLSTFDRGETVEGMTFYSKFIGGIQNGAPDGMSLDVGGEVVHLLSYEGGFLAANGPAAGLFAWDIGVAQSELTPPGSSLGLIGAGAGPSDFLWSALGESTPGRLNFGQTLVPEPPPGALLVVGAVALGAMRRRREKKSGTPETRVSSPR
ncbi:MAG: PEP-CTERM sorting domain-containing protein [Verrucomicrobiae bacterium]|nr:PEP-CTERM sorting domain-containing protein [Verrucomicrobiae bacterium]